MTLITDADRVAPAGQFRIIGVDTYEPDSWIAGDYPTLAEAIKAADKLGAPKVLAHVHDDQGRHVYEAGTF